MKTNLLRLVSALAIILLSGRAAAAQEAPLKVIVMAGQSNMVGMRGVIEELPPELKGPIPNVLFFDGQNWIPLEAGKTEAKGFGPEIAFVKNFQARINEPVGIIKHSKGGSILASNWSPKSKQLNLYFQLLEKVKAAKQSRPIEIIGTVWMQGESDAVNEHRANAYAGNLAFLISCLRREFQSPDMWFVCGRVNPPVEKYPLTDVVRKAQETCDVPRYAYVNCDDLPKGPDNLHYNTAGLVELGRRFAEAAGKFLPGAK